MDVCFEERYELQGATVPVAETKSSGADLVTEYDRQCEELVLKMLSEFSPDWKVVSEESHPDAPLTDEPTWIVDPIDGTTSFVHGSFDCGVSIGLAVNKVSVLGVVYLPRLKETFTAIAGQGAYLHDGNQKRKIHVSNVTELNKAIVCTHTPYNRAPQSIKSIMSINTELLERGVHAVRAYGSAAMDICSVACGRLDLYFEVGPHSWDMCAAAVILREAGGVIHDIDAVSDSLDMKSRGYAAGSCVQLTTIAVELNNKYDYRNTLLGAEKAAKEAKVAEQ